MNEYHRISRGLTVTIPVFKQNLQHRQTKPCSHCGKSTNKGYYSQSVIGNYIDRKEVRVNDVYCADCFDFIPLIEQAIG